MIIEKQHFAEDHSTNTIEVNDNDSSSTTTRDSNLSISTSSYQNKFSSSVATSCNNKRRIDSSSNIRKLKKRRLI